jgi:AraC-like DNA-binding protein
MTRMSAMAHQFGMSERTLQRRLANEGVSFQDLLDEARKDAAARYLRESTLAIGEIAYLRGYSEPAGFTARSNGGTDRRPSASERLHVDRRRPCDFSLNG